MPQEETSAHPEKASGDDGQRPEQHGPEMDDTQVQATGELADLFEAATPEDQQQDQAGGAAQA
jgi:hypothetical protein